jgi:hypothetical protein
MGAILGVLVVTAIFNARGGSHPIRRVVVIAGNALMIGLMARMLTPFTIAPGLAAVTGMVLLTGPMFRGRTYTVIVAGAFSLACLVPFFIEYAGLASETTGFDGETVLLRSPAVAFPIGPTVLGLVVFAIVFIVAGAVLARSQERLHLEAKLRVHLQAWRLRQLV